MSVLQSSIVSTDSICCWSKQENWWPWPSGWGNLLQNILSTSRTVSLLTRSTTTCSKGATGLLKAKSSAPSFLVTQSTEWSERAPNACHIMFFQSCTKKTDQMKEVQLNRMQLHVCVVKKHTCITCVYICCMRFLWLQNYFNRTMEG